MLAFVADDPAVPLPRWQRSHRRDKEELRDVVAAATDRSRDKPDTADFQPSSSSHAEPATRQRRLHHARQRSHRSATSGAASIFAQDPNEDQLRLGTRAAASSALVRRESTPVARADTALRRGIELTGVAPGQKAVGREQRRVLV